MARQAEYDLITGQPRNNQFPNKWATLPGIGRSPEPRTDNAVVPYTGRRNHDYDESEGGGGGGSVRRPAPDGEVLERVRILEERLISSEKANRTLLEEMLRLQGDYKAVARRQEDTANVERKARMQIENSLRASNDLIAQLASRLKRSEDRQQEDYSTVAALVSHSKSVDQSLKAQQEEVSNRKNVQKNRIEDLRSEMEGVMQAKDNLERVSFTLMEEVRSLKTKVEAQNVELGATATELKNRTRRLEEENRAGIDAIRRQSENQQTSELTTTQLRQQIESRLSELRDVVVDLRTRQEQSNQDNHRLEQQVHIKVGDLTAAIQEQSRKREEAMHSFETMQRERDHSSDIEKTRLQSKIAEIAEEVSKKLLVKEIKLREELQQRYALLEAMMREETEAKHQFERDLKRDITEKMDALKSEGSNEVKQAIETIKADKKKQNETLQKLMEAQNLLDKQQEELKKQQDKVIAAEIHSRKRHEKLTNEKMESLQEKLSVATATLQQALGGVSMQINAVAEKLDDEVIDRERSFSKLSRARRDPTVLKFMEDQTTLVESLAKRIGKLDRELKRVGWALKDLKESQEEGEEINHINDRMSSHKKDLNGLKDDLEELRREMKDMAVEGSTMGARTYTDLDARVSAQANKINQLEDLFDAKLQAMSAVQAQNIREKVESISLWQEVTQQTLKEIQNQVQAASEEFYLADERQKLMKAEVKQRVAAESEARAREVEELRSETEAVVRRMDAMDGKAKEKMEEDDIENIQASIRKLAESISTVKSVLGMKMQSEQKLRDKQHREMLDALADLRGQLEPVIKRLAKKRDDKKGDKGDKDDKDDKDAANESKNNNNSNNNNNNDDDDDDDPGGSNTNNNNNEESEADGNEKEDDEDNKDDDGDDGDGGESDTGESEGSDGESKEEDDDDDNKDDNKKDENKADNDDDGAKTGGGGKNAAS